MEHKSAFLLIEDNLIDQLVIKQLLKKVLNIDLIYVANNGKEGIQWLLSNKKRLYPLIILLDIQMPVMNGFEFLDAFQKLKGGVKKNIQIFVLSSTLDSDEIERIRRSNYVSGFLNKPFPIEEFKRKIYFEW